MNAIILAAGMGTRLRPLTDKVPKALVETAGESFFSRQLRLLRAAGVKGITVVTGYHAEAFEPWMGQPNLEFVFNAHYHDRNNLFSMLLVADRLSRDPEGCLVLEGDVWPGEGVLPSQPLPRSSWLVGHREAMENEWVVHEAPDGRVTEIEVASGSGWILTGMSFWLPADGRKLATLMAEMAGRPGSENLFWDEAPRRNLDSIEVRARRIGESDWQEIDTLEDRARLEAALAGASAFRLPTARP
jgi:CTP:phosphocholine cytidylyltransferase-like protein